MLPMSSFLQKKIMDVGGPADLLASTASTASHAASAWSMWGLRPKAQGLPVTALIKVSFRNCQCYAGTSASQFSSEARLLHEYFARPTDSYTLRVEDVKTCFQVQTLYSKRGRHAGQGGSHRGTLSVSLISRPKAPYTKTSS